MLWSLIRKTSGASNEYLELMCWGVSNKYLEQMFSWRNKKKYQYILAEKSALSEAVDNVFILSIQTDKPEQTV